MTNNKKDILIIMGRYLPGYKDGGPVRSIKNLVDYLGDEYNFKILTCDRDHGDLEQYPDIKVNDWNIVGKAQVYYVPPKGFKFSIIKKIANDCNLVYCCGCFNDYAIKTLLLKRINKIKVPVVVASMGLFSPNAFKIKYYKKKLFTFVFNLFGLFSRVYWSASSQREKLDIISKINTNNNIFIAEDIPRKIDSKEIKKEKEINHLKVVWISRISENKNLIGTIEILKNVKSNIEFNIYGPVHDAEYWNKCEHKLNNLPQNISWRWYGNLESESVINVLKKQHVFLFPTLGENYGHVIQESLSAGCPVIISDQTPWMNVEENGAGYIFSINEIDKFTNAVEKYASMNKSEFQKCSDDALLYITKENEDNIKNTGYREIFKL